MTKVKFKSTGNNSQQAKKIINNYSSTKNEIVNKLRYESLTSFAKNIISIDDCVLKKIRGLSSKQKSPSTILDSYNELISSSTDKEFIELHILIDLINDGKLLLSNNVSADFEINIDNNLDFIEYSNYQKNFIKVNKPNLLWDCNFGVTKGSKCKNCPIHSQFKSKEKGLEFTKSFHNDLIRINYHDLIIYWQCHNSLWPPSIDTLHLINILKSKKYHEKLIRTVTDIGSGTGILGIWLAKFNKNVTDITFTDWLLLPLLYSYFNTYNNYINCNKRFLLGLNTDWMGDNKKSKRDLIICNPPYLPDLGYSKILAQSTVAGTDLLTHMIKYYNHFGNELVISFSNLALSEANKVAKSKGINLENCQLGSYRVPFRLPKVFANLEYIDKLVKQRGLEYNKDEKVYEYWHTINVYSLKR